MKKTVMIVTVLVLVAGAVLAQSQNVPSIEEAIRIVEGYWHCIGNGDFEGLKNYATDELVEISKDLYKAITDNDKQDLKSFTILKMLKIEKHYDNFICHYNTSIPWLGRSFLKKANGVWKCSG
jgi:hypothetical protein